ncbi:hypothetical protein FKW77_003937 [Venturia effusa]|uniref:Uncharacterized protein n=1 Tax=Venturia effusa TaxID=50376 RepID=A0A517LML5_9PEZI|nr:hypothetical protein FKW77_003937 [Venturia effusa]
MAFSYQQSYMAESDMRLPPVTGVLAPIHQMSPSVFVMKLCITLVFLTAVVSVSAKAYKYCCCAKKHRGRWNCDNVATWAIISTDKYYFKKGWRMSPEVWHLEQNAPIACRGCYAHASKTLDDGMIGIKEMSHLCYFYGGTGDNACFDPDPQRIPAGARND